MPETVIRVVLADDHPVVLAGLRPAGNASGFEVVGEAGDGESVIRQVQLTHPHVVLMDLCMPGTDGLEATRRIRAAAPDTAVLVLTMLDDDETVFAAMRPGAHGYLLKGAGQRELERALRGVVAGEVIFGPGVAARMLQHFTDGDDARPFADLTGREREILDLIAAGLRNPAIAERLHLAPKTVANHISSIFTTLRVTDRSALIVQAENRGSVDVDEGTVAFVIAALTLPSARRSSSGSRVPGSSTSAPAGGLRGRCRGHDRLHRGIRRALGGPRLLGARDPMPATRYARRVLRCAAVRCGVPVTVSGNELPGMGAAVEVATYRICVEALTNIVRHAHATAAELTLTATADSLTIEVTDDGKTTGIWPPGTGITSMRERAALVGGTLTADDRRVLANLPL